MIMYIVFILVMVGVLIMMFFVLVWAVLGLTVFDRILVANMFGTKMVLFILVVGFFIGRLEWLDLVIVYVLVNFVGIIVVVKYCRFGNLVYDGQWRESR